MALDRLDELINRLLAEAVGRIFVINVMQHVEISHLNRGTFQDAWRHIIDIDTSNPRDSKSIIELIGRWPGRSDGTYTGMASWLQGQQRPDDLARWESVDLVNVCKKERLDALTNAHSILSGSSASTANPTKRSKLFLIWLAEASLVPIGIIANRARDLLGLVHHTLETKAELVQITFPAKAISKLYRPTALESGANSRFRAVCEEEWKQRSTNPAVRHMGMSVDLERVRNKLPPLVGMAESVAIASGDLFASRSGERHLGLVTQPEADDRTRDDYFEKDIGMGKNKADLETFLRDIYAGVP